ncbi:MULTISPECIES: TetR/AcrR family transcriptional regulator [Undibacterium]|uniref:TetR/AcrR family transcriptional regulator n=1 Tax=Undibacterium aquatile TaxID=1537398 RepID=A0ABR6XCN6_9BURK|nr:MULTISPECIES: TetR/AcrR family transcriptional regulator [Undibacterium]MBC3810570.1 TetR/AcrR family transcriptional regulator [Undibacterium aquatile]MBC3927346.1 TetR/AcrR family transcriptional regulator [Undibacterium sp. CY21W]MBY0571419.1 TetR/AcrR family transcriptional regulator [Burkholderiaceae bacterium]
MKMKTEAKRQAILSVAAQAFQELGFERTSMSEICARLGGSKATLYNYFASKEELFFEIMYKSAETKRQAMFDAFDQTNTDITDALRYFGEHLLSFLYSPEIMAQRHMAITAPGQLGKLLYERGILSSQSIITNFLQDAMTQGKLRQGNAAVATLQLHGLLEAELINPFLFKLLEHVSEAEIKAMTARAIDVFMAAYAPQKPAQTT